MTLEEFKAHVEDAKYFVKDHKAVSIVIAVLVLIIILK